MLNLECKVTYRDGSVKEATTAPKDEVALERQYDVSIAQLTDSGPSGVMLLSSMRVEHLYYLAWSALSRTSQEHRDFDSFLDVISDLDFGSEDEPAADEVAEPDPTRSGVSPD